MGQDHGLQQRPGIRPEGKVNVMHLKGLDVSDAIQVGRNHFENPRR